MYILQFNKNRSKNFYKALMFARELGGSFDGQLVTIKVDEENLLNAYSTFRTLFGIVQNWKSTKATYRGEPVNPYLFILKMHRVRDCVLTEDCGQQWQCNKLTDINHNIHKFGVSWFNIGHFHGHKWIIDKKEIKERLIKQSKGLGVDICPSFDETELLDLISKLPDYILPDGVYYKIIYKEKIIDGTILRFKDNIRQLRSEPNRLTLN